MNTKLEFSTTNGDFVVLDFNDYLRLKILYLVNLSNDKDVIGFNYLTGRQRELSKSYHKAVKAAMRSYSVFEKYSKKEFKGRLEFIGDTVNMFDFQWAKIFPNDVTNDSNIKEHGLKFLKENNLDPNELLVIYRVIKNSKF